MFLKDYEKLLKLRKLVEVAEVFDIFLIDYVLGRYIFLKGYDGKEAGSLHG